MESIPIKLSTWLAGAPKMKLASVSEVRAADGFRVRDFPDLVTKVAHLSFFNPSFQMLFRGQSSDHKNRAKLTTLLPSLFRATGYLTKAIAQKRFDDLSRAESEFCKRAKFKGKTRVCRYRLLQWALLQHYEVCATPLLDVTHSLNVACSFSKLGHEADETLLYVLGIPYLSGCITTAGDQGIQALRLLSVCPPQARRPHFQEGYLIGEYPEVSLAAREKYKKEEWDFGRRLICKFALPPSADLWSGQYTPLPQDTLFPQSDPIKTLAEDVKKAANL